MRRPFAQRSRSMALRRRGVSLLEFLCAAVMLTAVMGVLFPLLARLSEVRDAVRARESAVRELGNILEIARSDGQVLEQELETVGAAIVKERLGTLDDVRFAVRKQEETAAAYPFGRVRPVRISIAWSAGKGRPQEVELACWLPVEKEAP